MSEREPRVSAADGAMAGPNSVAGRGSSQTATGRSFFRTNRGIGLTVLILVAVMAGSIWSSDWAQRVLRDGFTLGTVPLFALGLMAVALCILMLDGQARSIEPAVAALTPVSVILVLTAAGVLGLTFLAWNQIGFIPATALFIGGGAVLLGTRPWWTAILTGISIAVILRVILHALGIEIADGLLAPLVQALPHV